MICKKLGLRGLWILMTILSLSMVPSAFAVILVPPSASVPPTNFTGTITGGAPAADVKYSGVILTDNTGANMGTGDLTVGVRTDAVSGFDFLYQWKVLTGDLGRLSVTNFTGFTTDVGYTTALSTVGLFDVTGANVPTSVQRPSQSTVAFDYSPALQPVLTTVILVVKVPDARGFNFFGNAAIQDGGNANRAAYQPTPEPTKVGLLVGFLFAAGLFVARRFQVLQT